MFKKWFYEHFVPRVENVLESKKLKKKTAFRQNPYCPDEDQLVS